MDAAARVRQADLVVFASIGGMDPEGNSSLRSQLHSRSENDPVMSKWTPMVFGGIRLC